MSRVIGVHELPPLRQAIPLGLQHLFAMFGATILVPLLTGLDPSVALLTSGAGTLLFILITQGKVPAYLGSSFAFIIPIQHAVTTWGIPAAMGGAVAAGLLYVVVALIIRLIGTGWVNRLLPPVVVGPVIIVIGLGLAPTAVEMAGLTGDGATLTNPAVLTALFTLAVALLASVKFRGFFASIPILIAIVAGYIFAYFAGLVDFEGVRAAKWFAWPAVTLPKWNLGAIALMLPPALVTLSEHLGHIIVLNRVVDRDYMKDPGLHRTLLGDGLATSLAGLFGGPPNTTYGENIGVLAITKVYSVWVIGLAAVFAFLLAFLQKVGAFIQSIPTPVLGGVSMLLFGVIASSGLRTLIENRVDLSKSRNLMISSVILVLGVGGSVLDLGGSVTLSSMALATVVGVILNLLLPEPVADKEREEEKSKVR